MSLIEWLRTAWRGYSDADVKSLQEKMAVVRKPYEIIPLSHSEWRALIDGAKVEQ